MTVSAVIPIKQLSDAKQRLGSLLSCSERTGLFRTMVEDVLTIVEVCPMVDEILVITSDVQVADLAREYSCRVLPEPENAGLINAVTAAAAFLVSEGVESMLFLPGDVPLVSLDELEVVLDGMGQRDESEFTIVPARDMGGSNCIACSPPDCMTFGFGEDSFRRHLHIAEARGIVPNVIHLPGIGLDVDTPSDLGELASIMSSEGFEEEKGTYRYLVESGILERLSCNLQELNE